MPMSPLIDSDTFESIEDFDTSCNKLLHLPFVKNLSSMKKLNSYLLDDSCEEGVKSMVDF